MKKMMAMMLASVMAAGTFTTCLLYTSGDDFDRAAVLALLEQNAHRAAEQTATVPLSLIHI